MGPKLILNSPRYYLATITSNYCIFFLSYLWELPTALLIHNFMSNSDISWIVVHSIGFNTAFGLPKWVAEIEVLWTTI